MVFSRCLISTAYLACAYAVQLRSTLQGCAYVEHDSVGSSVDGGWVNDWDNNMNFECPSGQILAGVYSVHDNGKEDRRWKMECVGFKAKTGYITPYLQSCSWSGYTGWDASWTAPSRGSNYVIVGVKSHHDNGKEDRQFSFKSCAVKGVDGNGQRSGVTPYQNSYDGSLDTKLSDTDFFGDWKSQHSNGAEDRQFAFDKTKFCYQAITASPTASPTVLTRATLKLNRKLSDNADVRDMYDELADAGDDCIHFPISSDGCGASQCTKGTNHHTTCNWSHKAASVSGTTAPYTISAAGLVQGSSSGCITANSCVMGMFETTKYSALCKGDSIEAVYSAAQGSDWFEVAMGLYEGTPGYNPTFVEKMIYRGSAVSNAVAKFTLPRSGDFFVRIFGASYDRTGGTWLGATLTLESEFEVVGSCSATGVTQQNANPPTPWPTPPPTNAAQPVTPSATGDPHLINSRGEHFNIFKTGQMEFLRVPYESVAAKADFTALATIQAVAETDNKCEQVQYITGMRFGGSWLKGKSLEINLDSINPGGVQKQMSVLLGGEQVMQSPEPIDVGEKMQLIWNNDEQAVLKVGEASVHMKLNHYFLNVDAHDFVSLGSKIGGLLGEDDHADVSTPPSGCEREMLAKASQQSYSSARMM